MIEELIRLATHLDSKGRHKEAEYLDIIIRKAGENPDDEGSNILNEGADTEEDKKVSKWHKMKMTRVVDEMDKNDFNSLSFEIGSYTVRVTRKREEDCE